MAINGECRIREIPSNIHEEVEDVTPAGHNHILRVKSKSVLSEQQACTKQSLIICEWSLSALGKAVSKSPQPTVSCIVANDTANPSEADILETCLPLVSGQGKTKFYCSPLDLGEPKQSGYHILMVQIFARYENFKLHSVGGNRTFLFNHSIENEGKPCISFGDSVQISVCDVNSDGNRSVGQTETLIVGLPGSKSLTEICLHSVLCLLHDGDRTGIVLCPQDGVVIQYEVYVSSLTKVKDIWDMTEDEKLEQAMVLKDCGNNLYKHKCISSAKECYDKALDYLCGIVRTSEDECGLRISVYLNLSQCYLQEGNGHEAQKNAQHVLKVSPNNEKGLFRCGEALILLSDFSAALKMYRTLHRAHPSNTVALQRIQLCQQRHMEQKLLEKKVFGGMFDRFAAVDQKKKEQRENEEPDVFDDLDQWDNQMAEGLMPLEEERRAFEEDLDEIEEQNGDDGAENGAAERSEGNGTAGGQNGKRSLKELLDDF